MVVEVKIPLPTQAENETVLKPTVLVAIGATQVAACRCEVEFARAAAVAARCRMM